MTDMWHTVTDIYFWQKLLGDSSYLMILICTILFIWLLLMFSSETSYPATSTNSRYRSQNASPNTSRQSKYNDSGSSTASTPSSKSSFSDDEPKSPPTTHFFDESMNQTTDELSASQLRQPNYNLNTANQFELVELHKRNYSDLIVDVPRGYRTVLIVILKQKYKKQLIQLCTKVCEKYTKYTYTFF